MPSVFNLEDVLEFLMKRVYELDPMNQGLEKWLRDRFWELEQREKVVLQEQADASER